MPALSNFAFTDTVAIQMSALSADQTIDALEAACDAVFAGLRADYLHHVAPTSDARMERHVQAFEAWQTAGVSVTYYRTIPSLTPPLRSVGDQLTKLLQTRLSGIYERTIDADAISDIGTTIKTNPGHDTRLVELIADVAAFLLYIRQPGHLQPDVSDLLSEI
ncbi:hypothetical protein SAMN04488003_1503 [Loktanella fryxellensis]|uniref:Uncharacterized protein n=1 Tax=Loktanella fryxellensis TaxID=245187 RepID=A0A1H8K3H8_9RHOB|nr:hypothetical protein [Loktanella fryxellensis]SEN87484.1 hypothetical protein SAMN04488003_1503 [Loktanella fryxellensis]